MTKPEHGQSLPETSAELGEAVLGLLQRATTHTLIPMLSARQRWQLLIEVLLGNAPARGGRARDYPLSVDRVEACRVATLLIRSRQKFSQWTCRETVEFSDYDFMVALLCVGLSEPDRKEAGSVSEERHFSAGIRFLTSRYFMDRAGDVADILGLAGQDTSDQASWSLKTPTVARARLLAAIAMTNAVTPESHPDAESAIRERFGPSAASLRALGCAQLQFLSVQSKKVQTLIDRGELSFIQRGASYWISQNLARLRDHLVQSVTPNRSVFLDNDAKTILVQSESIDLSVIEADLEDALFDRGDKARISPEWVARHFPRLSPFLRAARGSGIGDGACLPVIQLSTTRVSALQTACDAVLSPGDASRLDMGTTLTPDLSPADGLTNGIESCSGVAGESRIGDPEHVLPPWLRRNKGEGYSLMGTAFSLAGLAYSRGTAFALAELLRLDHDIVARPMDTQLELVKALRSTVAADGTGKHAGTLSHVKLDGDKVGNLFLSRATLRRPALSIELEVLMRDALVASLASVIRTFKLEFVPALLIYFGGDDLLLTLPAQYVNRFLEKFDDEIARVSESHLALKFTFAGVNFDVSETRDAMGPDRAQPDRYTMISVNRHLKAAKQIRQLGENERRLIHGWMELPRSHGLVGMTASPG